MLTDRSGRTTQDRGAVAVLVVIVVAAVILPLLALLMNLGLTRLLASRSQTATDAAALAAAASLRASATDTVAAEAAAKAAVAANLAAPSGGTWTDAWSACTDPSALASRAPDSSCISFDLVAKHVRVTVPAQAVPTAFPGVTGSAASSSAAAWGEESIGNASSAAACAFCVAMDYNGGTRRVAVTGGDVAVGGTLSGLVAQAVSVSGGTVTFGSGVAPSVGTILPPPTLGPTTVPAADDPLAAAAAAIAVPYGATSATVTASGQQCKPGIYQDITLCGSFLPGTYFVTGTPFNSTRVQLGADAAGVLVYFTCSTVRWTGTVVAAPCPSLGAPSFRGVNASHTLTAPGGGSNLALVFDDGLSTAQRINGGGQLDVNGSIYAPQTPFRTSSTGLTRVHGGRVVLGSTSFSTSTFGAGNTVLSIDGPTLQSSGTGSGQVRLVPPG